MLHDRSGGSTNDIVGTYGDDLTPSQSLDALVDEPSVGTWQLVITDHAGSDTGTLNAWGVEICGRPADAATPEMRLRDLDVLPGGVQLRWWVYPGMLRYKVYRSDDASSSEAFVDITAEDDDDTDMVFLDTSTAPLSYYLVTGVGPTGEGPR
jgi:subtilisin-like proprotein convertase family protein